MMIWLVMDGDYDGDWVVAAYDSDALANDHIDRTGVGRVQEVVVLSVLDDSVASIDPVLARQARTDADVLARAKYATEQARLNEQDARTEAMTIGDRASLCHCLIFSSDSYFITAHGYCRYCGGWTPEVFRARFGDDGLMNDIDRLAEHDRVKMRQFTGLAK